MSVSDHLEDILNELDLTDKEYIKLKAGITIEITKAQVDTAISIRTRIAKGAKPANAIAQELGFEEQI